VFIGKWAINMLVDRCVLVIEWEELDDDIDCLMIIYYINQYKLPKKEERMIISHLKRRFNNISCYDGIIKKSLNQFPKEIVYQVLSSAVNIGTIDEFVQKYQKVS